MAPDRGLREIVPASVALRLDEPDRAALATLIERALVADALRARLAAAGPPHAARFSWAGVARRTAAVHTVLAARSAVRAAVRA